jgi:flagella synthesis protein FlgN
MNRREAFKKIFNGMRADVRDYSVLRELLQTQFTAALQHRTDEIRDVGERITGLASLLEARRSERVDLVVAIAGPSSRASITAVAARLQGASRTAFDTCWSALEQSVKECKALNMRNCRLLMDQHDIMRRVLSTEVDTYAPA